ncbi:MAG: hypothetical protein PSX37_03335, partial [bacterium]|nr:hypothetical protein [bacterium]
MSDSHNRRPAVNPTLGSGPIAASPGAFAPHAFTFLNSFCTTILTTAIFFLTKNAYHFSQAQNLMLAVLLGVTYIFGAKYAGSLSRLFRRIVPGGSTRGILAVVLVALCLLCLTPLLFTAFSPSTGSWPIWFVIGIYSPLTGILWPLVESYIASGKRGQQLVSTIGVWNVNWSAAGAIASIAFAPLVAKHALEGMALLGLIHLASSVCLRWFSANPAPHGDGSHEPHPP